MMAKAAAPEAAKPVVPTVASMALKAVAHELPPTVLQRRQTFEQKHPDFKIIAPVRDLTRGWQVETPADGVLRFGPHEAAKMMSELERRYPL
jgi:hypothetical protein